MCIAALALILGIIVAEALYSEPLALIAIPLTICGDHGGFFRNDG